MRKFVLLVVVGLIILLGGTWFDGHAATKPPRKAHAAAPLRNDFWKWIREHPVTP